MRWDPQQYVRFEDERGRPFADLLARVGATAPRRVVDLGCGPGTLTASLHGRWPHADIEGIDASPDMIAAAAPLAADRLTFRVGDVTTWSMPADLDVLITNATLQWVPSHRGLLAAWAAALPSGAWLAMQVPGNFAAPSHAAIRELADEWGVAGALRVDAVDGPADYATLLLDAGLAVDVWETTYLHVLPGADPVLEWLRGTGLRPVLAGLPDDAVDEFSAALSARLRDAYPPGPRGTLFPFRRIFAVAHRP